MNVSKFFSVSFQLSYKKTIWIQIVFYYSDRYHSMRQSAETTMTLVTWCHVSRGSSHVPPREPLAKQHELDNFFFEGDDAETPNFQGKYALVWHSCNVSDDREGSKMCPQGTI